MNNKSITKTIVYAFITAFVFSPLIISDNNKVFAFIGFNLFGTGEEDQSTTTTSQKSSSFQHARCYSPTGSIVDSCNSGDLSNSTNDKYNVLGQ